MDRRRLAIPPAGPPTTDCVRRTVRFGITHKLEMGGGRWAMIVDAMEAFSMARMGAILGEEGGLEIEISRTPTKRSVCSEASLAPRAVDNAEAALTKGMRAQSR